MTEQQTPAELGAAHGMWTRATLAENGWDSAQACLEHEEQTYLEYQAALQRITDPTFRAQQAEYFEAWIIAVRASLTALMEGS